MMGWEAKIDSQECLSLSLSFGLGLVRYEVVCEASSTHTSTSAVALAHEGRPIDHSPYPPTSQFSRKSPERAVGLD
jgi:hypothetical protein